MPLALPMDDERSSSSQGCLYVVATPIGNINDITLRALQTLAEVDLVAAEDTRTAARFLAGHNIKKRLLSYHEHNEEERTPELVQLLRTGKSIALISEAGTPTVSDPGFRLIQAAIAEAVQVIPIPGVSAAITALSVSGLPTDSFLFVGFPAKKRSKRLQQLETLKHHRETLILYVSPKRLLALIDEIILLFGDRYAILARELTKKHEEFIRNRLSEIGRQMSQRKAIKGECTLIVAGSSGDTQKLPSHEQLEAEIRQGLANRTKPTVIAKMLAAKYNLKKNNIYHHILETEITDIEE